MNINLKLTDAAQTCVYRSIAETGEYEPEIFALLLSILDEQPNSAFLNVGSNIGIFPLAASKLALLKKKSFFIFAHEPLPMLRMISQNLMNANEINYTLRSEALGESVGMSEFYVSARSDSSNSLVKDFRPAKEVLTVQVETLDSLYLECLRELKQVILIIDVETSEPAVLLGGSQLLKEIRPLVICEVLANRTENSLAKIFLTHQYSSYRFDGHAWVREEMIRGDTTYKYRDWFFVPVERAHEFGDRYKTPASYEVTFSF